MLLLHLQWKMLQCLLATGNMIIYKSNIINALMRKQLWWCMQCIVSRNVVYLYVYICRYLCMMILMARPMFSIHICLVLHAIQQQYNEHLTVNIRFNTGNCII